MTAFTPSLKTIMLQWLPMEGKDQNHPVSHHQAPGMCYSYALKCSTQLLSGMRVLGDLATVI